MLRDPFSNPDHTLAESWVASAIPGGMPAGFPSPLTFDRWRALLFEGYSITNLDLSSPSADPDEDGLPNFAEYALGLHPLRGQPILSKMLLTFETIGNTRYAVVEYRVATSAVEASVSLHTSINLIDWTTGPSSTQLLLSRPNTEGTTTLRHRSVLSDATSPQFFRLHTARP